MTGKRRRISHDIAPVQAARLKVPALERALRTGEVDPYPYGEAKAGSDAIELARSPDDAPRIMGGMLRGMDGGLPDYLLESLFHGLHNDDNSLFDFLAVIDRRLMALSLRAETARILVSSVDIGREKPRLPQNLLRLLARNDGRLAFLPLISALTQRSRPLETLRRVLHWWTGRPANVSASFSTRYRVDDEARMKLSASGKPKNLLGRGSLIGQFGTTNMGRISIRLGAASFDDLDRLANDRSQLDDMTDIIRGYLRDPVPVTVYAEVRRKYLPDPVLSASRARRDRLGAYHCLLPQSAPDENALIKILNIPTGA